MRKPSAQAKAILSYTPWRRRLCPAFECIRERPRKIGGRQRSWRKPLALYLTIGAFMVNFVIVHLMFLSEGGIRTDLFERHFRFEREVTRFYLQHPESRKRWRKISRVSLRNPQQSRRERLEAMESDLGRSLKQKVVSCKKEYENNTRSTDRRCDAYLYNNDTNKRRQLAFCNPLPRDQFLCGGEVVLGPESCKFLETDHGEKCGYGPEIYSHSFPRAPTFENRGKFPGIRVQKRAHVKDDTFSSGASFDGTEDFGTRSCDVKCDYTVGGVTAGHIYGVDASFKISMEGEALHSALKIDKNAWRGHKFYATTSLQSDVPFTYFSMWWGAEGSEYDTGLQTAPVPFSEGIRGAVFLAKNCKSKSNREKLVKELFQTSLRVDSLSSCLNNGTVPPGAELTNKRLLLGRYMFYLAFENQRTDDYITEKFWNALLSGTIPVYFGAPNIKEHFPLKGAIFVDDFENTTELAEYLIKVSEDEDLYNSYHAWRNQSYPPAFFEMHNRTLTPATCRLCSWAHAYKYGLGWNHEKQAIEPVVLPRETCVDGCLLHSPASESWWSLDENGRTLSSVEVTPLTGNASLESECPLSNESVAKVGSDLIRKVRSNDGCTDFYIQGNASRPLVLSLKFPMRDHGPLRAVDSRTAWIQNNVSRASLVVERSDGAPELSIAATAGGRVDVPIEPGALPIRLRIIVENLDLFHEGALDVPSYYGSNMAEDVWNHPEVFALERSVQYLQIMAKTVFGRDRKM